MLIKFRLSERKEWDRKIIKWLKKVPYGYRSALIKQKLYEMLDNEKPTGNHMAVEKNPSQRENHDNEVDEKIKKLLRF